MCLLIFIILILVTIKSCFFISNLLEGSDVEYNTLFIKCQGRVNKVYFLIFIKITHMIMAIIEIPNIIQEYEIAC